MIVFTKIIFFIFVFSSAILNVYACNDHHKDAEKLAKTQIDQAQKGNKAVFEFAGTLKTGMMAIGGESTGVMVLGEDESYELSFTNRLDLEKKLENYNGKKVQVIGQLKHVQGVEIAVRRIIEVSDLKLLE